jgi:AcrR family transcriptional regulator
MTAADEPTSTQAETSSRDGTKGPQGGSKARRKSAEERREEVLAVAVKHFARGGYHGTSTEAIARDAGISQPYLFRLFRTKQELFLACNQRACEKVLEVFRRAAAEAPPGAKLEAMGHAYTTQLLPDRHAVLMMMQGFAATSEREIQVDVRRRYGDVVTEVTRLSGADPDEVWRFFAIGMLLNIVTALDIGEIADEAPWAAAWVQHGEIRG